MLKLCFEVSATSALPTLGLLLRRKRLKVAQSIVGQKAQAKVAEHPESWVGGGEYSYPRQRQARLMGAMARAALP